MIPVIISLTNDITDRDIEVTIRQLIEKGLKVLDPDQERKNIKYLSLIRGEIEKKNISNLKKLYFVVSVSEKGKEYKEI